MIDNLDIIKPVLLFESEDDFYYLQILQRKKENPQIGSNSRVVKNYYINSLQYLESHYEEIKALCVQFNARAMLRLNKRSYEKVAYKTIQNVANSISNREFYFIKKSYDRACGQGHNDKRKLWILDMDGDMPFTLVDLEIEIKKKEQNEPLILIRQLGTKNGYHMIVRAFDSRDLQKRWPMIELHKDNPINLFIP